MNFDQIFGPGFQDLVANLGTGAGPIILAVVFLTVVLAVYAIGSLVTSRDPVQHRLVGDAVDTEVVTPNLRRDRDSSFWASMVRTIENHGFPMNEKARTAMRMRMYQAGFTRPSAVAIHYILRFVIAIGAPIGFLLLLPSIAPDMSVKKIFMWTGVVTFMAIFLPRLYVSHRIDKRKLFYTEAFPDALDMLVVCVEAGLALDAAIARVGEKIARAHPLLAEQFAMVSLELRAGKSRMDALRNMAERVDIDELNSFITLLIQSDQLGTSMAQTLRVYAEEMRIKRMLRAEEMAHKLPVKLVVPLVTCILPAMITAVLLPAMIRIIRDVLPALG